MPPGGSDESPLQRLHSRFATGPCLCHQFLDRLAYFEWRGIVRHRLPEIDRHWIRNAAWNLPDESPLFETEDAAPHAIQSHRNNRRLDILHDSFESPTKRKHLANTRDLALGKYADNLAVPDRIAGFPQRLDHLARPLLRGNRNHAEYLRQRFDPRHFIAGLIHHEANLPVGRSEE